jgi:hypothetical protein
MIDLPPEQVIEHRLSECGLKLSGITVAYEQILQSIEVVIAPQAIATKNDFQCIFDAAGLEIVTFTDPDVAQQYSEFMSELFRPKMLEDAQKTLDKLGLLENFPVRASFDTDKHYAEALEVHCGLEKGEALKEEGNGVIFLPADIGSTDYQAFSDKYSCLLTAATYAMAKGEWNGLGFVGNENYSVEEEQK